MWAMDLFKEYLSQFQRKAEKYYNLKKEFEATALTSTSLLGSERLSSINVSGLCYAYVSFICFFFF